MNLLLRAFQPSGRKRRKFVCIYLTLGFPSLRATEKLIREFDRFGVDVIELGIPFSDPLADGPTIQRASDQALRRGTKIQDAFSLVKRLRRRGCKIPIMLFGYLNPILNMGIDRFAAQTAACGAQGAIIPDLPPEEGRKFKASFRRRGILQVYLATPTTSEARMRLIVKCSQGFIYFVSVCGVTGARRTLSRDLPRSVKRLKRLTQKPVLIGFGISRPEHVKEICRFADGVIVGSAVIDSLFCDRSGFPKTLRFVQKLVDTARAEV